VTQGKDCLRQQSVIKQNYSICIIKENVKSNLSPGIRASNLP